MGKKRITRGEEEERLRRGRERTRLQRGDSKDKEERLEKPGEKLKEREGKIHRQCRKPSFQVEVEGDCDFAAGGGG